MVSFKHKEAKMTVITIPKILRERLTDEGAEAFVQILDRVEDRTQKAVMEMAEERFERRLTEEIGKVKTEIANTRADLIKWMFIFWVGQVSTITAILFAFFKK